MKKTAIQTRGRHLNHVAYLYDPLIECFSFGREKKFRERTLRYMQVAPGEQVLDIGCGTGSLTLLVADLVGKGGMVTGIDAAPRMIDIARKKAKKKGVPAQFFAEAAEALSFADNSFTMVVNSMFCHHIDHELKKKAFAEMYRVLKVGGRLITADIDKPTTFLGWLSGWSGRWLLLQPELADNLRGELPVLMAEAGFSSVRQLDHVHGLISFFEAKKTNSALQDSL